MATVIMGKVTQRQRPCQQKLCPYLYGSIVAVLVLLRHVLSLAFAGLPLHGVGSRHGLLLRVP